MITPKVRSGGALSIQRFLVECGFAPAGHIKSGEFKLSMDKSQIERSKDNGKKHSVDLQSFCYGIEDTPKQINWLIENVPSMFFGEN
jgi:hypothetical protein